MAWVYWIGSRIRPDIFVMVSACLRCLILIQDDDDDEEKQLFSERSRLGMELNLLN